MARKMPGTWLVKAPNMWKKAFGIWMGTCAFWILFSGLSFAKSDPVKSKTLQILQLNFSQKPEDVQTKLLREMALVDSDEAIPFFVTVSLSHAYTQHIREEAIKAMLAVDSKKYRVMLEPLQKMPLKDDLIIRNVQLLEGIDLLKPFLESLTFREERRIIDMKLSVILRLWKEDEIKKFNFLSWPSKKASASLWSMIKVTKGATQKTRLIQLWGKVRDETTTKEMVKLLDDPDPQVQEAVIMALSEPGYNAVPALGRFLQKSKDPVLRKRTIYALHKINNDYAKTALRSYLPQATAEEKKWINEFLRK